MMSKTIKINDKTKTDLDVIKLVEGKSIINIVDKLVSGKRKKLRL